MTAWSAKVRTRSICRSVNDSTRLRERDNADRHAVAQQRHPKSSTVPGRHTLGKRVVRVGGAILDVHDPAFKRHPPGDALAAEDNCLLARDFPKLGLLCKARHIAVDL